jgi:hypothetical protein
MIGSMASYSTERITLFSFSDFTCHPYNEELLTYFQNDYSQA